MEWMESASVVVILLLLLHGLNVDDSHGTSRLLG